MSLVHCPAPTDRSKPPTRQSRRRRWTIVSLALLMTAAVLWELLTGSGWLTTAWSATAAASPGWLIGTLLAALASMACFGMARRAALHAAAISVSKAQAIGVSFAAGALHATAPGGTVLAAAYAFRRMRTWGASASVAAWCLATTGVIASVTLTVFAFAGIATGGATTHAALVVETATGAAVIAVLVTLARHPHRLIRPTTSVLRWANRARSQPAEAGLDSLLSIIEDLTTIRPTRRQWLTCAVWSLANWALDAIAFWAAAFAVGVHVSLAGMVIAYTAGMVAVTISPLPSGTGAVEAAMVIGHATAGATAPAALAAVLIYRLISIGSTAAVGWSLITGQQVGRRRRGRGHYRVFDT